MFLRDRSQVFRRELAFFARQSGGGGSGLGGSGFWGRFVLRLRLVSRDVRAAVDRQIEVECSDVSLP
jgi:hypothetical protein